jgi:hypothetical protein
MVNVAEILPELESGVVEEGRPSGCQSTLTQLRSAGSTAKGCAQCGTCGAVKPVGRARKRVSGRADEHLVTEPSYVESEQSTQGEPYLWVLAGLLCLLAASAGSALLRLGPLNPIINTGISVTNTLVVMAVSCTRAAPAVSRG